MTTDKRASLKMKGRSLRAAIEIVPQGMQEPRPLAIRSSIHGSENYSPIYFSSSVVTIEVYPDLISEQNKPSVFL